MIRDTPGGVEIDIRPLNPFAFAAATPTPAGGSASALTAAVGAALLTMVAGLPRTRSGSDDDRRVLSAATFALTGVRHQLTEAIDADAAAFGQVVAAGRLARTSAGEADARTAAALALRAAIEVPLEVMRLSSIALKQARAVAERGHRPALSDVGVAIALLGAGCQGARLSVRSNLAGVGDAAFVDAINAEVERLSQDSAEAATSAERALESA